MSTTPRLQPRLCGVHHVKLPVSDIQASRDWYCRALGFEPELDFVGDGMLMGVGLSHPGGLRLGLRCDRDRTAALVGFDPLALAVPGRAELDAWLAHLDALGAPTARCCMAARGRSSPSTTPTASRSGCTPSTRPAKSLRQ
jgi:hypothetical protein